MMSDMRLRPPTHRSDATSGAVVYYYLTKTNKVSPVRNLFVAWTSTKFLSTPRPGVLTRVGPTPPGAALARCAPTWVVIAFSIGAHHAIHLCLQDDPRQIRCAIIVTVVLVRVGVGRERILRRRQRTAHARRAEP